MSYPPDDDTDQGEPSREAVTPRGGFMARPGLKQPPRHAVVVRVGDAPATGEIPLARQSKPPPEPALPPSNRSLAQDDKVTLRAVPTPSAPRAADLPPVIESVPPPSDMPVVASVRPPERSKTSRRSGAAIAWAAAAGIVLGLGSVAMSRLAASRSAAPASAGIAEPQLEPAGAAAVPLAPPSPLASSAPVPSQRAVAAPSAAPPGGTPAKPARRAIF
jgi:hypothetical protein